MGNTRDKSSSPSDEKPVEAIPAPPSPHVDVQGVTLHEAVSLGEYMKQTYGIEATVGGAVVMGPGLDSPDHARVASPTTLLAASALAQEIAAFERDLPQLLTNDLGKFSVYVGAELIGTFATESEAFDAGYDRTEFQRPFLMRRIEPNHEGLASSWQMGRPMA